MSASYPVWLQGSSISDTDFGANAACIFLSPSEVRMDFTNCGFRELGHQVGAVPFQSNTDGSAKSAGVHQETSLSRGGIHSCTNLIHVYIGTVKYRAQVLPMRCWNSRELIDLQPVTLKVRMRRNSGNRQSVGTKILLGYQR